MNYEIGDMVSIKQWDTMVTKHGFVPESTDIINVPFKFVYSMRSCCGNIYTIIDKKLDESTGRYMYKLNEPMEWSFSDCSFIKPSLEQTHNYIVY